MHDAQTPQQALDIAAAATRQAHEAVAVPKWGPMTAGLLSALFVVLIHAVFEDGLGMVLRAILLATTIAVMVALYKLVRWMRDLRRARGVIPRSSQMNQAVALLWLFLPDVLAAPMLGRWVWHDQAARPRAMSWKSRLRTPRWKS
ncbi:hypothetical protein [Nocardia sp. NPDC046763]|uniref:hypothetical protein n=1 Tax=Nocardia sp. NPDC046763 TaxID=3155256 RepID=UPI003407F51E